MNISVLLPLGDVTERNLFCLESLVRTLPPNWRGELVLIAADDARKNVTARWLFERCRWVLANSASRAAALQAAARGVSAPILCFLDPNTIFLPGWLPPMLHALQTFPSAGCVGNIHREPYSGLIDHAGIGFDAGGLAVSLGRNRALLPRDTYDRHPVVSMACCLVRRELFEGVGGFDDGFHGPLAEVDFCLRAAEAGHRHYVANRSVVYRYDDAEPLADDSGFALYQQRWGRRARACLARHAQLQRGSQDASFSAEHWEIARETRRLLRREIRDTNAEGWRYLTKHWHRPWRYNVRRTSRALVQALTPSPAPLPPIPGAPAETTRPDDGWLFNPPPQS